MTLILFRGVPASGKSTVARLMANMMPDEFVRVNRDDIRMLLFGATRFYDDLANEKEKATTVVEHSMIKSALISGKTPIVDATNLNIRSVKTILRIAGSLGHEVVNVDFPISLAEAIRRDAGRTKRVGEDVIKKFFQKYKIDKVTGNLPEMPEVPTLDKIEPVIQDSSLPTAVVVDLDGTICQHVDRSPYDYTKVLTDEPIQFVIDILESLADNHEIIFLSGRKDSCYEDTKVWLAKHVPFWKGKLFMRPNDSNIPDYIVKENLFNENINGKYNVVGVFDDREQVCRLWYAKGLPLFRVGSPDASF